MGKDYKQFDFNDKNDYLYVFLQLISRAYLLLKRLKKYKIGLEEYIVSLQEIGIEYIDEDIHAEWHDKILSVNRGLITIYIDDVKGGYSYVKMRKLLSRTQYKLEPISSDLQKELEELRDVRNWSYHLPQTDLVAMKEVFSKNVPKELQKILTYQFNPIRIGVADKCSIAIILSLYLHCERRLRVFTEIFNIMLKDYETLLGQKVHIIEIPEAPMELLGDNLSIAQLSMAMNKRKYDGSDEKFDEITFRNSKGDE